MRKFGEMAIVGRPQRTSVLVLFGGFRKSKMTGA